MPATWEECREGLGIIRVGPDHWTYGDPYEFQVIGDYVAPGPIELKGLDRPGYTRQHRDEIAVLLLQKGFVDWCYCRYKNGVKIISYSGPIRLSASYLKEHDHVLRSRSHSPGRARGA